MEMWKDIEGSKGYQISSFGRVKNKHNKFLCPSNNNTKKYWRVGIGFEKGYKHQSIHRLVAKTFIANPSNLPQVNHKDGNKDNNNVENLEWCSNKHNSYHANKTGLRDDFYNTLRGESSRFNKYAEEVIRMIPELINDGISYRNVARILMIPVSLITEIKAGRAWKHLNIEIPDSKRYIRKI